MIISRITSGLGNQLFQYALGRRISHMNNMPLKLDISTFETYKKIPSSWEIPIRTYRLSHFNILEDIATKDEVENVRKKSTFLEKLRPYHKRSYIKEQNRQFNPDVLNISASAYLEGYWQCAQYFIDIEKIIRREFTLKDTLDSANEDMAQNIKNSESISVHVRRGDYVSNPGTKKKFGTCSLDYYRRAIEKIADLASHPHFFVFSDDVAWGKENLIIEYPTTYVDINGHEKDYADLWLMSLCEHHIIANSSFSWWGAWLCSNKYKVIIAPKKWFNLSEAENNIETRDRIPKSWIRL